MLGKVLKVMAKGKESETNLLLKNHIEKIKLSKEEIEIKFIYQNNEWQEETPPTHISKKEQKFRAGAGKQDTLKIAGQGKNVTSEAVSSQNRANFEDNQANIHQNQEKPLDDSCGSGADEQQISRGNFDLLGGSMAGDLAGAGIIETGNQQKSREKLSEETRASKLAIGSKALNN